ncbi:hypothetical protein ACJMK2_016426 [Sinanodonta woodiana]|uniref:Caveolin n=1 Tax=Sinanodonta woodiana TaxID=1069815 RepID=A0ABD3UVM5_SINWO
MSLKGRNISGETTHLEVSFDDEITDDGRNNQEQTRSMGKDKTMKKIGNLFLKSEADIPLTVRDPGHLNDFVKVSFEDVFAEPDGSHSFDAIWKTSHIVFMESRLCCYRALTSICAVPCALYWGINFACLSFDLIWWIQPWLRSIQVILKPLASICIMCLKALVDPCFESCGKFLANIRLNLSKDSNGSTRA